MLRRWCVVLAMAALTFGLALTASSASAAPSYGGSFTPGGPIHLVGANAAHGRGLRFQAESTNWSGYAGTTGKYTSVSASWTQPAGTCSRGDQYAAFWVGLDGYSSSTVEQTGSEVDCIGRTAQYYAWYEMYPGPSENYSNTVRAGDHFTATVTYLSGEKFSLYIADTTQGWSHTTDASLGQTPSLSSAEAIVEAPCCTNSGGILPLTDFGTMSFTGSMANGSAIGNAGGVTEIIMVDNAGRDKDTISALGGGENFSATWLRSN
jgi:Peptidase A4 family